MLFAAASLLLTACRGYSDASDPQPVIPRYTVTASIAGLNSSGLVLTNGMDQLSVAASGTTLAFPTTLTAGSGYAVAVQAAPVGMMCSVANGSGTIAASNVTNVAVTCSARSYLLGGSVSGLSATGLVLANGSDHLAVAPGATRFTLPTAVAFATPYAVTVQSSPAGLTCSVANAMGVMGTADVNNVVVTCSTQSFALGGTISGLHGTGLVLANGTNQLSVAAGATTFNLAPVAFTSSYAVVVSSQPVGASCTVTAGAGTMSAADVTSVAVTCSDQPYSLGGTVSGLTSAGLVLANGSDQLSVPAGASIFTMPAPLNFASAYAITVITQPTGMTCTVSTGAGTMPAADVSSVSVVCANRSYTLGGSVSGLGSAGLVLANGSDSLAVAAGSTSFTMPASVAFGSAYAVTVSVQPTGATCTVSTGSGTMPAGGVSGVAVVCSNQAYTLGGSITGLTAGGLVLTDGIDWVSVASNASVFSMPTGIAYTSHYAVTVAAQPSGLSCTVTSGSGTMPAANVSSVQVTCGARYWTWLGGSSGMRSSGVYGTKGTAAAGNVPGARLGAMVWQGSATQRWLFGGVGTDANGNTSGLSDLWTYNQNTNQWTWVSGQNTVDGNGTFGTQGVAAPGNLPSSRKNSMTWTDGAGTLWVFGGYHDGTGNGYLNDLWSYNPGTNQWTWVKGSSTSNGGNSSCTNALGVYGTKGTAAAGNTPGARLAAVTWIDGTGRFWVHGGYGCDVAGTIGSLSDLWSYDPGTNQWTWISGANTVNASGVYGTQGAAAVSNLPGGRQAAASWVDAAGRFWLFGGAGRDSSGADGALSDLWAFDPGTSLWTWVSGSTQINAPGVYGVAGNRPGARYSVQAYLDSHGHFLVFGGYGRDGQGTAGWLNDLWSYDPVASQWSWVSGSSTADVVGVYGSLGVAAPGNRPGARFQPVGWIDGADRLWVFGGYGRDATTADYFGPLNDLFRF